MTLPLLGASWLAAIAAVALWDVPPWAAALAVAALAGILVWPKDRSGIIVTVVCGLLALAGAWRFAAWRDAPPGDIARHVGHTAVVEGTIVSEPDPGETWTSYEVAAERIDDGAGWQATDGRVRISLGQYAEYLPGTRVRLEGPLKDPPVYPDFDYRSYLARRGVFASMAPKAMTVVGDAPTWSLATQVVRLRLALDHALQRSLPEPEASLGAGIAFGRDGGIPDSLYNDFRDTGLAHIVAVSGSNVSLVAALTFAVFIPVVGRRRAVVPAVLVIVTYLVIAGLSASVMRAGVMAVVFLGGTYLGRQQSALSALAVAAIAMTAVQPAAAADLGFQLSLAATAGLIVFGPWIRAALDFSLRRGKATALVPSWIVQVLALTLSATVATLPITWVNFGRISLVGPLANIIVEPVFVFAFWLGAIAAFAGLLSPGAGWVAGLAAYYPLAFVTWFAHTLASIDAAAIDTPGANGTIAAGAYLLLCAAGWPAYARFAPVVPAAVEHRKLERRVRRTTVAAAAVVVVGASLPVSLLGTLEPGELQMTVLEGEGDAVLFTTPAGHHVLVNAGPSGVATARELGAVLPHWERTIDAVFVTRPEDEQAGGVSGLLDRYHVPRLFGGTAGTRTLDSTGASWQMLRQGDRYELDGVSFEVLWPPGDGESDGSASDGLALRVTYRGARFLLPSNLAAASQKQLLGDTRADVLVVPHHGSNKTDAPFIEAVAPRLAIVPVGTGSYAAVPAREALAAAPPALVLRTDERGRVTVSTNGQELHYQTAR